MSAPCHLPLVNFVPFRYKDGCANYQRSAAADTTAAIALPITAGVPELLEQWTSSAQLAYVEWQTY